MNQLAEFFSKLLDSSDWPPRWHCGRWTEFHGWLYIISDLLIWSAYFTIPLVIVKYISKKQDVRFVKLYFLFAAFILACGATHFLDAIAFWIPAYRLSALVRLITGILSWTTVFYLIKFLPLAFSLKSQQELENEIEQRKRAEGKIRQLNAELEQRVSDRTSELYKSEQKYRHLFENNPMPMWVIDLERFGFLDVNEAAVLHYGYSREEFLSMTALDIRPMEEVALFKQADHAATIGPATYNRGRWKHRKKDGTIIQVEIVAHNILYEGKTARFILSNDVTARLQTEEALRESQQLLTAIVDNSEAVIYVKDLEGRYLMVNRRFLELFKLTRQAVEGKTDHDIFPPDVADALRIVDERAARSDHPLTEQELVPHDNKMHTYISVKSTLSDASGKPYAVFGISTDITKMKAVEEELYKLNEELENRVQLRTTQLEAANKELESFSYSVSHDLRAPLRGIIGFTTMLEEDYSAKLDDEARRITSIIKNNTLKMGHLIDGLLTFSRMTRQDITKMDIDTGKMVQDIIEELAPAKAIDWHIGALLPVRGDYNTLRQVWINLVSNAIKYSSNNEHPVIETGSYKQEGETVFFIKDNGVGFDNKYKDKLFRVFQRLHRSDEFEGTGVGLALVEKIISKHGGKVWADAEVNKGARFYFSLPDE